MTQAMTRRKRAAAGKILTVSNRGPFEFHRDAAGEIVAEAGTGGLSNALRVAAQLHPAVWLSSPLTDIDRAIAAKEIAPPPENNGSAHFVLTDPEQYELFYGTFANEVLWFLQHGMPWPKDLTLERRRRGRIEGYIPVNKAFAKAIVDEWDTGEFRAIVIHDYHFYLVPRLVRQQRPEVYLQHFIHIPWPEPKEWARLRNYTMAEICGGLAANDSLVFQTPGSAHNFIATCERFLPGAVTDIEAGTVEFQGHTTRVWANGISVDPEELEEASASPEFSRYRYLLRPERGQKTIVRVDRLDPTKNVVRGFEAYALLLEKHPELRDKVSFIAQLVPSKSDIEIYQRYQYETHSLASEINRRFGNLHWKPIRVFFEHNRIQGLAAMSLADVLLVNPLADGMNLVAKEAPMVNMHDGVLVLSKAAGAYAELGCAAIGIDPKDVKGTANALYEALMMPIEERHERAKRLRAVVRSRDLRDWFRVLLDDIEQNAPSAAISAA
ncbi:MAG TPA: trehalose-6-phosphate synthase [Dehalococcoidia bacterium]|nr:trehalose-6-phosphate synthase [Dehalococcoidia bacterium]